MCLIIAKLTVPCTYHVFICGIQRILVLYSSSMKRENYSHHMYRHILFYYTLLCFTDTAFFCCVCFYKPRFVATLHCSSLLAPFFQQHLAHLCLCVMFWDSHSISKHVKAKDYDLWKGSDDAYYF